MNSHDFTGQVGITLNVAYAEPEDPANPADVAAAERSLQFEFGWFAHSIFIDGDYPQVMKDKVWHKTQFSFFFQTNPSQ